MTRTQSRRDGARRPRTAVCTIVSKNYLAYARTLMDSLAAAEPDWDRFVLLVDRLDGVVDPGAESFTLVQVEDLPMREKNRMLFHYGILEMNTAAKPWLLDWLLGEKGYSRAVFLDPDIFVYGQMTAITRAWDEGALAVLTPHLTGRLSDDRQPRELDILRAGTYNLGFVALARHPALRSLLDYWQEKSISEFASEPESGLFTDQKWMDLVPGLFADVRILRDEGYNVAYWNLAHRSVKRTKAGWRVNGAPLVFFHFSGLDPVDPGPFSKHQDRYDLGKLGDARILVKRYCDAILQRGYAACRRWPYAYAFFDDGTRIPDPFRVLLRRSRELQQLAGTDPFAAGPGVFNHAWVEGGSAPPVTWAMRAIWEVRKDLQASLPDPAGADRARLHDWFVSHAVEDVGMPATFVPRSRAPVPREAAAPEAGSGSKRMGTQQGFYAQRPEERATGLRWMGGAAWISLDGAAGKSCSIRGYHRADLYEQAGLDRRLELRAEIGGQLVGATTLVDGGGFSLAFRVPSFAGRRSTLRLVASQVFVPSAAGIGTDARALSVQVAAIELDGKVVFGTGARATDPVHAVSPRRMFADLSGVYPRDSADREHGLAWMGPDVRVRVPPLAAGAKLVILGEYHPHGLQSKLGSARTTIEIALDARRVCEAVLEAAGDFRIDAVVPDGLPVVEGDSQVLSLRADRSAVPARLGVSRDVRSLVARLRRIEIDGEAVLDFSRADPTVHCRAANAASVLGINVIGYAHADSGLGQSARGAAASCEAAGIPVALYDFREGLGTGAGEPHQSPLLSESPPHGVNLFHVNADQMGVVAPMLEEAVLRGRYNVGCWHWELPEIPDDWLASFDPLDEIWAPSRFVMEAVAAKSPIPVAYLPHGVEFQVRPDARRSHFGLPERTFLFLMMYDTRSYQERKNPDGVLAAWSQAFDSDRTDVNLVIKTTYSEADPEAFAALRERVAGMKNVRLLSERYDRQTAYDLHSLVDCYVQLHRSEGWGLNLAEAMYLGKPVIGTNWSGNTDFMNPVNSCAVDYQLVRLDRDHGPYRKGQVWADPDSGHAAWFMKKLVEDPSYARDVALRGQATMLRDFSHRAAGDRYRKRLEIIRRLI